MQAQNLFVAIKFAFLIVFPNLVLMALGFWLKKHGRIDADFVNMSSRLVFDIALPCLLFFSLIKSGGDDAQFRLLLAGMITTFVLFFGAELYAKFFVADVKDKGVFVQGVFRSNMAIIALSVVSNAYGDRGTSVGAVYMGVITILYNVLSVITLSRTQTEHSFGAQAWSIFKKIVSNPLIIALVAAFLYKLLHLGAPPEPIRRTGDLLASIALPLALICAGASLDVRSMLGLSGVSMRASIGRIVIAPIVAVAVGVLFELEPMHFGVLFAMVAAPVAAASYVMAKAMGGNEVVAANILAFTTVFGMISMAIGIAWLRMLGWV